MQDLGCDSKWPIYWDAICEKFNFNSAMMAKTKAIIKSFQPPQKKDLERWKNFFDFFVLKARDYSQRTKLAAAAA